MKVKAKYKIVMSRYSLDIEIRFWVDDRIIWYKTLWCLAAKKTLEHDTEFRERCLWLLKEMNREKIIEKVKMAVESSIRANAIRSKKRTRTIKQQLRDKILELNKDNTIIFEVEE